MKFSEKTMKVPNWQHHSNKEQKRHLKPQALRQAKKRRNQLIKRLDSLSSVPLIYKALDKC